MMPSRISTEEFTLRMRRIKPARICNNAFARYQFIFEHITRGLKTTRKDIAQGG